jgi:hypothetical protein
LEFKKFLVKPNRRFKKIDFKDDLNYFDDDVLVGGNNMLFEED